MAKTKFKNIFKTALYVASISGLSYFVLIMILHMLGLSLSIWIDLIYKFVIIASVIFSIIVYRVRYAANGMPFWPAFGLGVLSSLILGIYMALSIFIFQTVIDPDYHKKYKELYTQKRSNQMYNTQLDTQIKEKGETYKLTASDSALVKKGLDLHLKNIALHFTPEISAAISLLFSLIWGVAVSATVSLLAVKK